jgi:hypothetical protein
MTPDLRERMARAIHTAHRNAPYPWWHESADKCKMAPHIADAVLATCGLRELIEAALAYHELWQSNIEDAPLIRARTKLCETAFALARAVRSP